LFKSPSAFFTHQIDEYKDFTKHLVNINTTTWTSTNTTDALYQSVDLFASYIAALPTQLANKLANFSFVKAKLRLTITVEGCPYAGGWYIYCFDPLPNGVITTTANHYVLPTPWLNRAVLLPHVDINPGSATTYQIDLPPPTITGYYTLKTVNTNSAAGLGSWGFSRAVAAKLISGTAVAPSLTITMFASLVDPEFIGVTLTMNEESTEGKYSIPLDQTSKVLNLVGQADPELAIYTTPLSIVAKITSVILAAFGFSKPVIPSKFIRVSGAVGNFAHVDGQSDAALVASSCVNAISISDDACPLLNKKDMIVSDLIARPSFLTQFSVLTTDAAGALKASIPITPCWVDKTYIANGQGGIELTPMGWIAATSDAWTGSLTLRFKFIASVFHRSTVAIFYDCGRTKLNAPTVASCYATLPNVTLTISGNTDYDYVVPWKQPDMFLVPDLGFFNVTTAAGTAYAVNGWVYVFVINPTTTNGSTDGIICCVQGFSSDMKFFGLTVNNIEPSITPPTIDLVMSDQIKPGVNTVPDEVGLMTYGEYPHITTKQIASRYTTAIKLTTSSLTALAPLSVVTTVPDGVWMRNALNTGTSNDINSLFSWMAMAYMGVRGSVNFVLDPTGDGQINTRSTYRSVRQVNNLATPLLATNTVKLPAVYDNFMAYTLTSGMVNPVQDFAIPQYYSGMFRPVYPMTSNNVGATQNPVGVTGSTTVNATLVNGTPFTSNDSRVLLALGDDGQFVFFRGVPPILYPAQ
jgi:hypothetical protein